MAFNDWTEDNSGNIVRKTTYRAELWEVSAHGLRSFAALHERSNSKAHATRYTREHVARLTKFHPTIPYQIRLATDYEITHVWDIEADAWRPYRDTDDDVPTVDMHGRTPEQIAWHHGGFEHRYTEKHNCEMCGILTMFYDEHNGNMYCEDCKAVIDEGENQVMDKARQIFQETAHTMEWTKRCLEQNPNSRKWKAEYTKINERMAATWNMGVALWGLDECQQMMEEQRRKIHGDIKTATTHDGVPVEIGMVEETYNGSSKHHVFVRHAQTKKRVTAWKGGAGMGLDVLMVDRWMADEYLKEFAEKIQDTQYRFADKTEVAA